MRRARTLTKGRPVLYGAAPWGYQLSADRTSLVPDGREQAITAIARHMRSNGMTLAQIVTGLQDLGATSRRGRPFTVSRVHEMLSGAEGLGIAPPESLGEPVATGPKSHTRIALSHLNVPEFARGYPLAELRLNPWTRRALQRAGVSTLGELHGRSAGSLCELPGVNLAMVQELRGVIDEVRAAGARLRGNLLDVLEAALSGLSTFSRTVLELRLGGTEAGPLPLPEVARRLGLGTGEAARQHETRALTALRVLVGPAFGQVLRDAAGRGAQGKEVSAETLAAEATRGRSHPPARERIAFYGRLLGRLQPELAGRARRSERG